MDALGLTPYFERMVGWLNQRLGKEAPQDEEERPEWGPDHPSYDEMGQ